MSKGNKIKVYAKQRVNFEVYALRFVDGGMGMGAVLGVALREGVRVHTFPLLLAFEPLEHGQRSEAFFQTWRVGRGDFGQGHGKKEWAGRRRPTGITP